MGGVCGGRWGGFGHFTDHSSMYPDVTREKVFHQQPEQLVISCKFIELRFEVRLTSVWATNNYDLFAVTT